jgi:hypothetical protein
MKTYGTVDVWIHIFLTSALAIGEWSVSRPCHFTPGERTPGTHWIGGWVDPRAGLDDMEKWKFFTLPVLELSFPLIVRPVASRYTDCAIPALDSSLLLKLKESYESDKCETWHRPVFTFVILPLASATPIVMYILYWSLKQLRKYFARHKTTSSVSCSSAERHCKTSC